MEALLRPCIQSIEGQCKLYDRKPRVSANFTSKEGIYLEALNAHRRCKKSLIK